MLLTIAEAKDHLRITTPDDDPGDVALTAKVAAAEAIILDYLNATAWWRAITPTWDAATLPEHVRAAMLLQLAELYRFRGDDVEGQTPPGTTGEDLAPRVAQILRRSRDPVVA